VPGLLETEKYARALITGTGVGASAERIDAQVAARMERQAIMDRDDPPRVCAIVDVRVLRYEIGDAQVMHDQIEHLIELSHRPNVTLHVLPSGTGAHPGLLGGMTIANFAGHERPGVAYMETPLAGWLVEEPEDVAEVILFYDTLRGEALSQKASAEFLAKVVEEWT
jgi:hypothetical protein